MDLDIKTNNIVRTMQELGVQRFITISAGGIYKELLQAFNEWDKQMVVVLVQSTWEPQR